MMKKELENRVGFILSWGAFVITILVTDRINSDPVNISKMLLLSVVAFSLVAVIILLMRELFTHSKFILIGSMSFLVVAAISVLTSLNPIERGLYGAFGRNTGLITYVSLIIIFLTSTLVSSDKSFQKVLNAFLLAGVFNVVLSFLDVAGLDLFKWENPYNAVLGTFGNPNFVSAFMGMFLTFLVVQFLDQSAETKSRLAYAILIISSIATIYLSKSLQGALVAAFGSSLAIYFFIRSKERLIKFSYIYLGGLITSAGVGLAGILNKGPLATYLYGPTVKFRGEYWQAGINMGMENPITGVGIDSYGIYYRTFRELSSTVAPGVNVGTDTAHNVYIDVFSGTGFPGLIFYVLINGAVLLAAVRHLRKHLSFDGRFLVLFLCWAGYQLQSIASINQLGLAVWGWLFGGLIVAYTRTYPQGEILDKSLKVKSGNFGKTRKEQPSQLLDASTSLKIMVGGVVGLLIALPPFVSDVKMRGLQTKKTITAEEISDFAQSWPIDNLRLNKVIVALANGNNNDKARELALFATSKFPNDYASWWALDQLTREGAPVKEAIRIKLHEIDPHNPEFFEK
jgi:O-antigen ligase